MRDNLNETAPAKATAAGRIFVTTGANAVAQRVITNAEIATAETTTATSWADLTTVGPTVSLTTGTMAIMAVSSLLTNDTAGSRTYMSWAVSGATTLAGTNSKALMTDPSAATRAIRASQVHFEAGLTGGANVFTAKYQVQSGTGTYSIRELVGIAL